MDVEELNIKSIDDLKYMTDCEMIENRPFVLIKHTEPFLKYFIGVIIKYDSKFNVIIRYLDNPLSSDKYWWYGGSNPGIDPLSYSILDYKELLSVEDMSPDGYDDIINLKKTKMYKIKDTFPYYNGKYGNIYTESYFKDLYEHNKKYLDNSNEIPDEIKKDFSLNIKRIKITKLLQIQSKFNTSDELIDDRVLKKYIFYQLNNAMKNKIYLNEKVDLKTIDAIRISLKRRNFKFQNSQYDLYTYLKIFSNIFENRYIIYSFEDYKPTMKIIGDFEENIYLYKINNIIYRIYEYKDEDNKENSTECS